MGKSSGNSGGDSGIGSQPATIETEVKIRWPKAHPAPPVFLEGHGYREIEARTLESDQLFDRESGELRASDRILRLRQAGDKATVTYKGAASRERYKSREELEVDVSDAAMFRLLASRLGFEPVFRYQKYRTKFAMDGEPGIVTVDETPIGIFLELEGPKYWIDQAAGTLGFHDADYITASYAKLYRDYRVEHPEAAADMVFVSEQ